MTVMERLKGRIWGISLLASIVLLLAVRNVDATQTGAASESSALVPHEHNHSDGWISWDDAVTAGKIVLMGNNDYKVVENLKVYLTDDMEAIKSLSITSAVTDFQFCLNGYDYTLPSEYYQFIVDQAGTQANVGVYNCKTTGKISKPTDNSGWSCYLFDFPNGSNFTMSGVNVEVYSNKTGNLIRSTGGDVNISNSIIKAFRIGSSYSYTNILYVTKDAENSNKVTITNSYLYSDYGVISPCSATLEIKDTALQTGQKTTIALASSGDAKVENCEITGRVSVSGSKVDFDNVNIETAATSYDVVEAQPDFENAVYSFKDCVFIGANGEYQRGIMMGDQYKPNSTYTIDNVVIKNCKEDFRLAPSSISVKLDIINIPDDTNYIFGCNYNVENSGPIFTSSVDFVDRLILSGKEGYSLKSEKNGDEYSATYIELGIIKQPTSNDPSVEVIGSASAQYEWYPGTVTTLIVATEAADGQSIKGNSYDGSVYDEETGYWSPGSYGDSSYSVYSTFKVEAGDEVLVLFDESIGNGSIYFGDIYQPALGESVRFIADRKTTQTLELYYNNDDKPSVKIMVIRRDLGENLEGQNTNILTGAEAGTYICKITWADGTVYYSDPVTVGGSYTIEQGTTENGTFEVKGSAVEGELVTVVTTPAEGYILNAIIVTDASGNEIAIDVLDGKGEFTMPGENVTIEVTFKLNIPDISDEPGEGSDDESDSEESGSIEEPGESGDAGDIKVENAEDNDFKAEVENVKDVISNVTVTEEEQELIDAGENMTIILELNDIGEDADTEEKEEILEEIDDMKLGTFINIELIKKIGTYTSNITKTKGAINISFVLPEALKNTDNKIVRTYYILRNHEGEITLIPVDFDKETSVVTFATDRFSTYAIVYKDSSVDDNTNNNNTNNDANNNTNTDSNPDKIPATGDSSAMYVYVVLLCVAIPAVVCKKKIVVE